MQKGCSWMDATQHVNVCTSKPPHNCAEAHNLQSREELSAHISQAMTVTNSVGWIKTLRKPFTQWETFEIPSSGRFVHRSLNLDETYPVVPICQICQTCELETPQKKSMVHLIWHLMLDMSPCLHFPHHTAIYWGRKKHWRHAANQKWCTLPLPSLSSAIFDYQRVHGITMDYTLILICSRIFVGFTLNIFEPFRNLQTRRG